MTTTAEIYFYYKIGLPVEKVIEFIKDLSNQAIELPRSRIERITRGLERDLWNMYIKAGILGSIRISLRVEVSGNTVRISSREGDLVMTYNVFKIDERTSLVEYYIKAVDRLSVILTPELPMLGQRFLRSLRLKYGDEIEVTELRRETFIELLDLITRGITPVARRPETEKREVVSRAPTPLPEAPVAQPSLPPEQVVPLTGGEKSREAIESIEKVVVSIKPTLSINCRDCILFDDVSGYCTLLMKRIEDPARPVCNGDGFIRKS